MQRQGTDDEVGFKDGQDIELRVGTDRLDRKVDGQGKVSGLVFLRGSGANHSCWAYRNLGLTARDLGGGDGWAVRIEE